MKLSNLVIENELNNLIISLYLEEAKKLGIDLQLNENISTFCQSDRFATFKLTDTTDLATLTKALPKIADMNVANTSKCVDAIRAKIASASNQNNSGATCNLADIKQMFSNKIGELKKAFTANIHKLSTMKSFDNMKNALGGIRKFFENMKAVLEIDASKENIELFENVLRTYEEEIIESCSSNKEVNDLISNIKKMTVGLNGGFDMSKIAQKDALAFRNDVITKFVSFLQNLEKQIRAKAG